MVTEFNIVLCIYVVRHMIKTFNKKKGQALIISSCLCFNAAMDNIKESEYRHWPNERTRVSSCILLLIFHVLTPHKAEQQLGTFKHLGRFRFLFCCSQVITTILPVCSSGLSFCLCTHLSSDAPETLSLYLLVYAAFEVFQEIKLVCGMILSILWSAGFAAAS